jgi:gliding motility-associated-like protein
MSNVDGEYAEMSPTGISSKANGYVKINSADPCSGPLSTLVPIPSSIDTIKVVLNNPLMCGYDTLFLKSIFKVHPNSVLCPNSNPISFGDTMRVIMSCPMAKITGKSSMCAGGKDTLTVSNLTPKPSSNNNYNWNTGNTTNSLVVSNSGCYKVTLTQNGCTSKDSFCVTIGSTPAVTIKSSLDSCNSVTYKSKTYFKDSTLTDTIKTASGMCDSLYIKQPIHILKMDTTILKSCNSSSISYNFFGTIINTPGTYYHTINRTNNCDSIIELVYSILLPNSVTNPKIMACQSYTFKGITYTSNTTLKDTLKSKSGCDSLYISTPLEIYPTILNPTITISGCDSVIFNSTTYFDTASMQNSIKSILSPTCDSIIQPYFIAVNKKPSISIITSPIPPFSKYDKIVLTAVGKGRFVWNNGDTNKTFNIVLTASTTYLVTITDSNNCINDTSIYLKVENNDVFLPNAFTPNTDGTNDMFEPNYDPPVEIKSMMIFNRWGEKIYEGLGNKVAWDGKYKGEPQPSGVYVYVLEYYSQGKLKVLKGSLSLIR